MAYVLAPTFDALDEISALALVASVDMVADALTRLELSKCTRPLACSAAHLHCPAHSSIQQNAPNQPEHEIRALRWQAGRVWSEAER
mmetsp:Transcript_18755/g.43147  ORF Transcript_18755/g.43147 Transcript_18755/m.43147 type:complete len:87 (-) Transcript_18755:376-636(-)